MKLKFIIGLILSTFIMCNFTPSQALAGTNYQARYAKQIKTNDSIRGAIKQALVELNNLHYTSYPDTKVIMQDAGDQIGYADKMRKKTEKLAKSGKWKAAAGWSGMELQYLIKAVVKARVVRNMLKSKNKKK